MRKILGYRPKTEKLDKAFCRLLNVNCIEGLIPEHTSGYNDIINYGVMHWFEEVYEDDKKFTGWAKDDEDPLWIAYFHKGEMKYGIDGCGNWIKNDDHYVEYDTKDGDRPATPEEIQQALIKEAKKRGFKKRVKFHYPDKLSLGTRVVKNNSFEYTPSLNTLCESSSRYNIFQDGKWAEIIPNENLNGKTAIIGGVEYELKIKN